ncbi:hypothetical protein MMC13_005700 [Lambiella insularis]|nr:hypothetical protein [Lambiella insularis]
MKSFFKSRMQRTANAQSTSNTERIAVPSAVSLTPIFASMSSTDASGFSTMNSANVSGHSPVSNPMNRSSPVSHSLLPSTSMNPVKSSATSSDRLANIGDANATLPVAGLPNPIMQLQDRTSSRESHSAMPGRGAVNTSLEVASSTGSLHPSFSSSNFPGETVHDRSSGNKANAHTSSSVINAQIVEIVALKKEKAILLAKLEDMTRSMEVAVTQNETLKVENLHLSALCGIHGVAMERVENKNDALKLRLAAEKAAREKAEREQKEVVAESFVTARTCEKRVAEEKAIAENLQREFKALANSWEAQAVQQLQEDITAIAQQAQVEDRDRRQAQYNSMQQGRELKILKKANRDLQEQVRKYKREPAVREVQALLAKARQHLEESDRAVQAFIAEAKERVEEAIRAVQGAFQDMKRVEGKMKYIMNVKRDVKDAE